MSSFFRRRVLHNKKRLTKRALDRWDSAAFSSIFLASSFLCSQALSTPAHLPVTQTVDAFRLQVSTANKNIGEVDSQPLQY